MASLNQLSAALIHAAQENTFALANIKFDFSIVKLEPPEEYRAVGELLSRNRKKSAEDGPFHITARKLGALFESEIPDVPHLLRAYGQRASEIVGQSDLNPKASSIYGAFADHVGADSTTIWATATSGGSTITMHLLACMLARIWQPVEAISIWSELIEQRKEVLRQRAKTMETALRINEEMASRIELSRDRLAEWDLSARTWLRTADGAKRVQQTQLRLVLDNISLPVSQSSSVYDAVMASWPSALKALDGLVQGKALRIQSGDVLLGLSSWHLYPDLSVLGSTCQHIRLGDPLMRPGSVVTIGLQNKSQGADDGIYWSLPLASMHFYGHPVYSTGHTGLRNSQVSFEQFEYVILGAVVQNWGWTRPDVSIPLELLCLLDWDPSKVCRGHCVPIWLKMLVTTAQRYKASSGPEREQISQLVDFGRRRSSKITHMDGITLPVFGLTALPLWLDVLTEKTPFSINGIPQYSYSKVVNFLCSWALGVPSKLNLEGATILYLDHEDVQATELLPSSGTNPRKRKKLPESRSSDGSSLGNRRSWTVWSARGRNDSFTKSVDIVNDDSAYIAQKGEMIEGDVFLSGKRHMFLCGTKKIAVYVPYSTSANNALIQSSQNRMSIKHLLACLKCGLLSKEHLATAIHSYRARVLTTHFTTAFDLSETADVLGYVGRLAMFATAASIFSKLPGSLVDLNVTSTWKHPSWWENFMARKSPELFRRNLEKYLWTGTFLEFSDVIFRSIVFSCIAYFDTGHLDLPPSQLEGAMAIAHQDSIYVLNTLLLDQSEADVNFCVRRITGSIGKPGLAILIPPSNPKIKDAGCDNWQLENKQFDGELVDNFAGTSLHLSLTGYELPFDSGRHGLRDSECTFIEAAVSLFDRGEWVADLDLLAAADTWQQGSTQDPCKMHTQEEQSDTSQLRSFLCLDSWVSLLDPPPTHSIMRARNNTGARLAATCLALQKKYEFHILRAADPCWACVESIGSSKATRDQRQRRQDDAKSDVGAEDDRRRSGAEAVQQLDDWEDSDSDDRSDSSSESGSDDDFLSSLVPEEPLFQDIAIQGIDISQRLPSEDGSSEAGFGGFAIGIIFIY